MSSTIVVGADGALGALLAAKLEARAVRLRHPADSLDARLAELAEAPFVVNVAGPRVRPKLGWDEYLREHVGTATAVAGSMRPGSHLLHFSSAAVYGARGGVIHADSPVAPSRFPNPSYAWAKLAGEFAVRAICRERQVGLTVLRPAMVYGDGVSSAIDTVASLARRGVRLDLRPSSIRQHCLSSALLLEIVRRLRERGAQERVILGCDPFAFTNGELEAALRVKRRGVGLPAPLPWAEAALRRWPGFPDREPPGALAAFAFLGLDNELDWRETLRLLAIDPEPFGRERTLEPFLEHLP